MGNVTYCSPSTGVEVSEDDKVKGDEGDRGSEDDSEEDFLTGGTIPKGITFTVSIGRKEGFGAIWRIERGAARAGTRIAEGTDAS
jgi:hypothetical protein